MVNFIEQIANADFSAILTLITTALSGGFGVALTIVANKLLKYKKSAQDITKGVKEEVVPAIKNNFDKMKKEIIEEVTKDFKVIAESIALLVANNPESKLAVVENISKIGISKEVKEEVVKVIEEEVQTKEEQKKEIEKVVEKLESNMIETL